MNRQFPQYAIRRRRRAGGRQKPSRCRLQLEILEDRLMLDAGASSQAPAAIVLGRTLATPSTATSVSPSPSYFVGEIQNDQVTITYTVYNESADPERGISLTDTLEPGVTVVSSVVTLDGTTTAQSPRQSGQNLAWSLDQIQGYDRESVALLVNLPVLGAGQTTPFAIDTGAQANAMLDGSAVSARAPAASIQPGNVADPGLLASTVDANSNDPYIQEEAAALDYDPAQIFNFLHTQIGYNSYRGSVRGARGTLWSDAGNALDVASLGVALMRASGIPAQYVSGTLSQSDAQQLILSMFPVTYQVVVGYVPPGTQVADLANDPQLLSETESHYWFEFDSGSGMTAADPLIPGATIGQAFAASSGTFTVVPSDLEAATEIQLVAEIDNTANSLFGLSGLTDTNVLDHTFDDVELVGEPISVANYVSTNPAGAIFAATTNTYTPYLAIGDEGSDLSKEEVIEGTPYQEVLTNFPIGSQILTGLFLNITVSGPGSSTQTYERTLVDRIGFAARQNGGSSATAIDPSAPPIIGPTDIYTVNVLAGLQNPNPAGPISSQVAALSAQVSTLSSTSQDSAALTSDTVQLITGEEQLQLINFLTASDASTAMLANRALVAAYYASPRITLVTFTTTAAQGSRSATSAFTIDLRADAIRAIEAPGQNAMAHVVFNTVYGFAESFLEGQIMSAIASASGTQNQAVSTFMIFQAAAAQNIGVVLITSQNLPELDALSISADAKARITQVVSQGNNVLVPRQSVTVNGQTTIAWYQVDPSTGDTIGVTEDGGHASSIVSEAFASLLIFTVVLAAIVTPSAFAAAQFAKAIVDLKNVPPKERQAFIQKLIQQFDKTHDLAFATEALFGIGLLYFNLPAYQPSGGGATGGGGSGGGTGGTGGNGAIVQGSGPNDPQLGNMLISPAPLGAFGSLAGTGVAVGIAPDAIYSLPVDGAQLPTFRIGIKNLESITDTFTLSPANAPAGFKVVTSVPTIVVPAGQTAEVGVYLIPASGLPAPGTQLSCTVAATSATDASITASQTESFAVPEIDAVSVTASPTAVGAIPGAPVSDTLTLTNVGNVPESNVTLSDTLSPGLTLNGLAPVSLALGQSTTETITLTPADSTPLNSALAATITATFGPSAAPVTESVSIPVNVVVPGAAAIAGASSAANQIGNTSLANQLGDLSIALTNLVQNPTSTVYQSQALAGLSAVDGLFAADPYLAALVPTLTSDGDTLAEADTAASVQAAVTALGDDLDTVGTTLSDEAAHGFTLGFVGANSQVAQPQVATTFQLSLQNTGSQSTTCELSLSGLPAGVTGSLSQSSITLGPGQVTPGTSGVPNLTITLTSTSATSLAPFSFTVTATAEGASEITQSITGSLSARSALVQVTSVTTNPAFINPGGLVDVQAEIRNAVNRQQQAEVSYTVTNASGAVVYTSTPVTTALNVLTTLSTVDLGNLNTAGFALGDDTITMTVGDASGNPIPGATGTGTLLIGTPVSATLTTSPASLPAGSGTVTETLQVNSRSTFAGPLALEGQTAVAGSTSVAVDGTLAYVGTSSDIAIVDISNPAKPVVLSTFGSGDFPAGSSVSLQVYNGELVVLAARNGATSSLLVYSLANAKSPSLLGQTPLTFNSGNDSYLEISSIANNQVYTSAIWYRFGGGNAIFAQFGESLDVDISNPAAPKVVAAIYNDPPSSSTGYPDGTSNVWQSATVNNDVLLVGSTTATAATTNGSGIQGIVMVVDTSNAGSPSVREKLAIPGMAVVTGIAVNGDEAFVIGSTENFSNGVSGLGGNVVVATLDLTNPDSPTVTSTQTLNVASIGISYLTSLGNNLYVTDSAAGPKNGPQMLLFNAGDPSNVAVTPITVPTSIGSAGLVASGNLLLTADGSNLLVYNLGQAAETPVTAKITVPTGDGVSVVPGSFNIAPSSTVSGASSETLEWDFAFTAGTTSQTITFQEAVTGLAAGQSQIVVQGGTVNFVSQGTPGTLSLPAQAVTGDEIIGLAPPTQTVAPGANASYMVKLTNPASNAVTYTLAVEGLPASWVHLGSITVSVAAGGTASVPLVVTSGPFAATGDDGFAVTASGNDGAIGSVQGDLVLQGQPAPPDPDSHGIVVSLTPATAMAGQGTSAQYVVQLTNTGSADDEFSLSTTGLPAGVTATFGQTTIAVPPGASNFHDVTLILTTAAGTKPGSIPFQVTATSTTDSSVLSRASGTLDVVAGGVSVSLNPSSAPPGSSLQAKVTNTCVVADTFKLALGGSAALISTLSTAQVTLAPGASQVVAIKTRTVKFADQGELSLTASATSTTNPAVSGAASANLSIPSTQNMKAAFSPASQTLSKPGTASFLLIVHNTGNSQDSYSATIVGTSGPVKARLAGLDGLPTQSVPLFVLPGLSTGAILVSADLSGLENSSVTVEVKSLTDGTITETVTASVNVTSTSGPRVIDVERFGYHMMPTTLLLTFDEALEAATADDPRNYEIFGPRGQRIRIKSAVYDAANDTVTLRPSQRISIHHRYTLIVKGDSAGGITNARGQSLDSKAGGPGADYLASLTWRNLVLDPPWPKPATHKKAAASTRKGRPNTQSAHVAKGARTLR
jgi:uncharacterized repeat protein (TIGR01451 family)